MKSAKLIFAVPNMAFKKQKDSEEQPALSNTDVYRLVYGKKPPGKLNKKWRKTKRLLRGDDTWQSSKSWNLAGFVFFLLAVIPFFYLWQGGQAYRRYLFPLQLGAALFFYLFFLSKTERESTIFKISGLLAMVLAVLVPVAVLNLQTSWQESALFLPAHFAICGVAALYRSEVGLELKYVVLKALSYTVFTLLIGWLSFYSLANMQW